MGTPYTNFARNIDIACFTHPTLLSGKLKMEKWKIVGCNYLHQNSDREIFVGFHPTYFPKWKIENGKWKIVGCNYLHRNSDSRRSGNA